MRIKPVPDIRYTLYTFLGCGRNYYCRRVKRFFCCATPCGVGWPVMVLQSQCCEKSDVSPSGIVSLLFTSSNGSVCRKQLHVHDTQHNKLRGNFKRHVQMMQCSRMNSTLSSIYIFLFCVGLPSGDYGWVKRTKRLMIELSSKDNTESRQ